MTIERCPNCCAEPIPPELMANSTLPEGALFCGQCKTAWRPGQAAPSYPEAEIERLNKWADGFSDAQLKERQTAEAYQRELREEIKRLRQGLERIAQYCGNRGVAVQSVAHMAREALTEPLGAETRAATSRELASTEDAGRPPPPDDVAIAWWYEGKSRE